MPNYTCATAIEITSLPFEVTIDTTAAPDGTEHDDDGGCGDGSGGSYNAVWYTYLQPAHMTRITTKMTDSTSQAVLTLLQGSCGSLNWDSCESNHGTPAGRTRTHTGLNEGERVFFMLTSYDDGGFPALTFRVEAPPVTGQFCTDIACASHPPPVVVASHVCCTDPDAPVDNWPGDVLPPVGTDWESTCEGGGIPPDADDLTGAETWE
jgi:hypothetical protein